jgi:iron complex outermembrane receptor protein
VHARYSNYRSAVIYIPGPGGVGWAVTTANLDGVRLEDAPSFTGNLSATQRFDLGSGWGASLTAAGRYSSEYDYLPDGGGPAHNSIQKAYGVANLTGYVQSPNDKYRIGFYCNNATGTKYDNFREVAAFGLFHTAALPRTYGVNFQYNF